jgi:DNA-directed RNA polymerase specialized sigma24 family protein
MSDVTQILSAIEQGDPQAAEQLLPLVYDELRKLAAQKLAQKKLARHSRPRRWCMRRMFDWWMSKKCRTGTGGGTSSRPRPRPYADSWWIARGATEPRNAAAITNALLYRTWPSAPDDPLDLLALDEALQELEEQHPRKAQIVKLRFAGLTLEETAQTLGVARATAQRNWAYARAWLFGKLNQT